MEEEGSMAIENISDDIKRRAGWSMLMGILTAVLGVFLISYPLVAAAITTIIIGWILIVAAVAHIVFAFHSQSAGRFFLKILLAVLYGIVGFRLVFTPLSGIAALTAFLGSLLVIYGIAGLVLAFQMRPSEGWGWYLMDAVSTLLIGILILSRWPSSSIWAIGTLVGVSVLMSGISRIMVAGRIRRGARLVDDTIRRAA
jgi:uncharacterized membrane protein HdeD (DUF308 family)